MNQPARSSRVCQEPVAAFSPSDVWLDVKVLADRYEALAALSPLDPPEDEPHEADEEEEASDDLPS